MDEEFKDEQEEQPVEQIEVVPETWFNPLTGFPMLSSKEVEVARLYLLAQMSVVEVVKNGGRDVATTFGAEWTHKCVCPNYQHKQGSERTASFSMSDRTQRFLCFGCSWFGDALTLAAYFAGRPEDDLIEELWGKQDLAVLNLKPKAYRPDIVKINHRLSVTLRDYLKGFKGTVCYADECRWVDQTFSMIDERLDKVNRDDPEAGKRLYNQVLMDLERRKNLRVVECKEIV